MKTSGDCINNKLTCNIAFQLFNGRYPYGVSSSIYSFNLIPSFINFDIYIGMDVTGRYAFEYTGRFHINKSIRSSSLIELTHYKQKDDRISMVLSLTDHKYLRQFCTFCNDIVNSTNTLKSEDISEYETICNILVAWRPVTSIPI